MSFKLFIFYCAVCGGWFALAGWGLGRALAPNADKVMARAIVQGLCLGMLVALGLGLVDGLWNLSSRQAGQVMMRGLVIGAIGCVSSVLGSAIGQNLMIQTQNELFYVVGWTLTGLLIGASFGAFDLGVRLMQSEDTRGALRKTLNGILGGTLGGFVGSILFLVLRVGLSTIFSKMPAEELVSSSLAGFVALGICIGLFIGLAQVILKEAWVRVESGFRPGRELILSKPETTIGKAESCDLGLFGGAGVEKLHASILSERGRFLLADNGTPGGTYLNEERVTEPTPLRSGDAIRVGNCVLRFAERQKRTAEARPVARSAKASSAQAGSDNPFANF